MNVKSQSELDIGGRETCCYYFTEVTFSESYTGLITRTSPQCTRELGYDPLDAEVSGAVAQVTGRLPVPGVVNVQVQRVETATVLHHRVKHTEPLTLLQE